MLCRRTILVSQLTFSFQNSKKGQNNSPSTILKFSSHSSFSTTFCLKKVLLSLSRIYDQKTPKPTKHLEHHFSISKKKGLVSFMSESRITVQLTFGKSIGICWQIHRKYLVLSEQLHPQPTFHQLCPSGFTLLHSSISLTILFKYLQDKTSQLKARLPAALLQNDLCQWKKITIPNCSQVSFCQGLFTDICWYA